MTNNIFSQSPVVSPPSLPGIRAIVRTLLTERCIREGVTVRPYEEWTFDEQQLAIRVAETAIKQFDHGLRDVRGQA